MKKSPMPRWQLILTIVYLVVVVVVALAGAFHITGASAATHQAATVRIPAVSTLYRMKLEREAVRHFGLDAPVARLAAQVHQESGWRANARSPYAQGMAQFTPSTARWLPTVCPEVGPADTWDPDWSLRALACYDAWLHARVKPLPGSSLSPCSRWAFTLRAYNGGESWLMRERRKAAASGANGNDWQAVASYRVRAEWAHRENTDYPRRILLKLEPAYRAAGWNGDHRC